MLQRARRTLPARRVLSAPVLALALALVTLLSMGPLIGLDRALNYPFAHHAPGLRDAVLLAATLGQRGVCLPLLFLVAAFYGRRLRTWEPLLLSAGGALAVNLLVGGIKLVTARDTPLLGNPFFFNEGVLYPSGHAANVVLVYGLTAYLVCHYGRPSGNTARVLAGAVTVLAVVMVGIGLYTRFHWFTDLVAGLVAGGLVLRLAVDAHRAYLRRRPRPDPSRHRTRATPPGGRT